MARETLSLKDAVQQLLDEARMVLPGIQALLGFQLIAVFNEGFARRLDGAEQRLHLVAILLVALATGLVMTPAAYHRQAMQRAVSESFLRLGSRLVSAALIPLGLGLSIDIYIVSRLVTESSGASAAIAAATLAVLFGLWLAFPRWRVVRDPTADES
jgi:hypothetical protein